MRIFLIHTLTLLVFQQIRVWF